MICTLHFLSPCGDAGWKTHLVQTALTGTGLHDHVQKCWHFTLSHSYPICIGCAGNASFHDQWCHLKGCSHWQWFTVHWRLYSYRCFCIDCIRGGSCSIYSLWKLGLWHDAHLFVQIYKYIYIKKHKCNSYIHWLIYTFLWWACF